VVILFVFALLPGVEPFACLEDLGSATPEKMPRLMDKQPDNVKIHTFKQLGRDCSSGIGWANFEESVGWKVPDRKSVV
jgi:hypothetical protein